MSMPHDLILPPDAPALPGLSFRPIRGEADADALRAVHLARRARDRIDPYFGLEDYPSREALRAALSQAMAGGRQDQWLVAQVGERVVGYSQIESWHEVDGTWVYLTQGWVVPEWRGRGIGSAMLHWTEERIHRLATGQHPHDKVELAANASSAELEATELLLHEGYRVGYTVLDMGLDISALPPVSAMPAGITARPGQADDRQAIAASLGEAFQDEYDANRYQETYDPVAYAAGLADPKHDPSLWQLAWDGDQLVGAVLSLVEKGGGEVFDVGVRPAWRRRGIARALLLRALHTMRERGVEVIRVGTVSDFRTRARDLYYGVGFRVLKEFPRYRKPFGR
jgi:mycothiol synthase